MSARDADPGFEFQDPSPEAPRCAYCRQPLEAPAPVLCSRCRTGYHEDCWSANRRRCAVYGCEPAPKPEPPPPPWPRELAAPQSSGSSRGIWIFVALVISSFGRMMGACGDQRAREAEPPQISSFPRYVPSSLPDWGQKNAYVYLRRGDDRKEAGFLESALEDYDIAIQLDPRIARAYRSRGDVKHAQGDLDAAIADCTKAIELDPEDPIAWRYRAASRQSRGDLVGAEADYSESLRLNPSEATAWSGRARVHRARNNLPAAIHDLNAAIEANPKDAKLFYDRGCARYHLGAWSEALADFEAVAANVPSLRDDAHLRMFYARLRMGRRDEAGIVLDHYLLNRKDADDRSLKSLHFALGRLTEQAYLEAMPAEHACEATFAVGTMRLIRGDKAGAREMFERCVATGKLQQSDYDSARAELLALRAGK
jgi:tetratricopeptide (TPR) repeat protein